MTVTCRRRWGQKHSIGFRGPREGSPNPMGERILKSLRKKVRKQQKKKRGGAEGSMQSRGNAWVALFTGTSHRGLL